LTGVLQAIFAGLSGRDLGRENATTRALVAQGMSPAFASVIARDPRLVQAAIGSLMGPRAPVTLGPGQRLVARGPDGSYREVASGGPRPPPPGYEWVDPNDQSKG